MIVVSDTGPLHYLSLIGHLDTLPTLYKQVVIPPAVGSELTRPSSPEIVRNLFSAPPPWLTIAVMPVVDRELSDLGEGEQQAISLARSLHAELLLCDDKDARDAAQKRSLRVIGTLGVLLEAARNGLLNLQLSLARLRATNFRISQSLIDRILEDQV